jgi:thymidylate kinase
MPRIASSLSIRKLADLFLPFIEAWDVVERKNFMPVYIFVLGRAGSGKSAATRYMAEHMQQQGWTPNRITDYDILYNMFREEQDKHRRFRPAAHGGFDVIDFSVLNEALSIVQRRAKEKLAESDRTFVTIEFARNDYKQAWPTFDLAFLQGAYFLFIDASHEICKTRIHRRVQEDPTNLDNHFVSDDILNQYYDSNKLGNRTYMSKDFPIDFSIDPTHVKVIDNNQDESDFLSAIHSFLEAVLNQHSVLIPSVS